MEYKYVDPNTQIEITVKTDNKKYLDVISALRWCCIRVQEEHDSHIFPKSLSGSKQSSSPKCSHDMIYPTDSGKPTCKYCGHQGF